MGDIRQFLRRMSRFMKGQVKFESACPAGQVPSKKFFEP